MPKQTEQRQVYIARTLEEAKGILNRAEGNKLESLLCRRYISAWVLMKNCFLRILQFCLFKKWGYSKKGFRNIVVYTVGIVGDNVVLLAALAALRRHYSSATITVVTNCQIWSPQAAVEVLGPSPYLDRLIVLDGDPVQREGFRIRMVATEVQGIQCDLFVNLSPLGNRGWFGAVIREMIFAKMLGANCAIGFQVSTHEFRKFSSVQHRFVKNEPTRAQEVIRKLGVRLVPGLFPLHPNTAARDTIFTKLSDYMGADKPLFVLNPGAKFRKKCWPASRFGMVASWLSEKYHADVVVTGTASEKTIAEEVVKASDGRAMNMAGETTIQELVELLRVASACITSDTGTMHLSATLGRPTVGVFRTRLAPAHWFPSGEKSIAVFSLLDSTNDVEASDSVEHVYVDDVIQAIEELIHTDSRVNPIG